MIQFQYKLKFAIVLWIDAQGIDICIYSFSNLSNTKMPTLPTLCFRGKLNGSLYPPLLFTELFLLFPCGIICLPCISCQLRCVCLNSVLVNLSGSGPIQFHHQGNWSVNYWNGLNNLDTPQTKLRKGNVFTGVCLFCSGGEGVHTPGGSHPDTWDTTGYGQQAGGTHPLEYFLVQILFMKSVQMPSM